VKDSRSDIFGSSIRLKRSLARVVFRAALPITLAASASISSAQTSWTTFCANSTTFNLASVKCGETGGNSGWSTSSPNGAFKSGGHDRTEDGLWTRDRFAGESRFGLGASALESAAGTLNGVPAGWASEARNSLFGSFQDTITPRGDLDHHVLTPVRFTLVHGGTLRASTSGPNTGSARVIASTRLSVSGDIRSDYFLSACASIWSGLASGGCAGQVSASAGTFSTVLTRDANLRIGETIPFLAEFASSTDAFARALQADYVGTSFASASSEVRLYIQPLDPRVTIETGSGFNYAPVPEPSAWVLLIAGFGIVLARSMRARKFG
jgi:hypothetical protein